MCYYDSNEKAIPLQLLESFLKQADTLFPVSLSAKLFPSTLSDYAKKLADKASLFYCIENDEIIGLIAGYLDHAADGIGYAALLAVLPDYQKLGIGEKLLDRFLSAAKDKQLRGIHLYAKEENTAAVSLYHKKGFHKWVSESDPRKDDLHLIRIFDEKTVLVTAIGSFSADITIKKLRNQSYRVIGTDIYPKEWVADSYNVNAFYQVPKVYDTEKYRDAILSICQKENVSFILPLTDVEVDFFKDNRHVFESKCICICLSGNKTLTICRNKKKQQEIITASLPEIRTIPTTYAKKADKPPFDYPIVCKLYNGRSSQGLLYIYNQEDWRSFQDSMKMEDYIIQPMIRGQVIAVDVVRDRDGKTVAVLPREELLRTLNGAGTSVRIFHDPVLEKSCTEIAALFQTIGCICFEFIRTEAGEDYYLECNPRFSGGLEFSCIAGYDCVSNHMKVFENAIIDTFTLTKEIYVARKYEEYVTKIRG